MTTMTSNMRPRCTLLTLLVIWVPVSLAVAGDLDCTDSASADKEECVLNKKYQLLEAAMSQHAGVYGWQEKVSMLPFHLWDHKIKAMRMKIFETWIDATYHTDKELWEQPPHPFNCQVFVNHRYKFMYIRHPKTGSTAMFTNYLGGTCSKGGENKPTCMLDLSDQKITVTDAMQLWKEYFVFTFVRNPWTRASSARDFASGVNRNRGQPACAPVDFGEYCSNPYIMGYKCIETPRCCRMTAYFEWHHVQSQARCMFTQEGRMVVDYIGRSERSNEDFKEVLGIINARRPAGTQPIPIPDQLEWHHGDKPGHAPTEVVHRHAKDYLDNPTCFLKLAHFWRQDIAWLNFSMEPVLEASEYLTGEQVTLDVVAMA